MTAEIIHLAEHRNPGNGAREAMMEIVGPPYLREGDNAIFVDWLLAELWLRGFVIVPMDDQI